MSATAKLHARYLPEVHSQTGAEKTIAYSLGESNLTTRLKDITEKLRNRASVVLLSRVELDHAKQLKSEDAVGMAILGELDAALTQLPAVVEDAVEIVALLEQGTGEQSKSPVAWVMFWHEAWWTGSRLERELGTIGGYSKPHARDDLPRLPKRRSL